MTMCSAPSPSAVSNVLPSRLARKPRSRVALLLAAGFAIFANAHTGAMARPVSWVDWTAASTGFPGSASGSADSPTGSITVSYSGEVLGQFGGIATTQTSGEGINFWRDAGLIVPAPSNAPYLSSVVTNGPGDSGSSDIICLVGDNINPIVNTINFSSPVTNPVMAILSLGGEGGSTTASYTFSNADFAVLSSGNGYWTRTLNNNDFLRRDAAGVLSGQGGHGVIQFIGTYSSISWTSTRETWHGFQIGLVPSPSAAALLCLGVATAARRRRA